MATERKVEVDVSQVHLHPIRDTDNRLVIDVNTKSVKMDKENAPAIAQYDHNSEYITFECDRFVEGHDLVVCTAVRVHYINQSPNGKYSSRGVYQAKDLRVSTSDNSKVTFSWLISEKATTYAGILSFVVSFTCSNDDDLTYRWNTNVCSDLRVGESFDYSDEIAQEYADVLEMWRIELFGIEGTAEANMRLYAQQQIDAMEVKAKQVRDSIPDEYMDYAQSIDGKANVEDINRLFDSDWVAGNRENLYPHGDSSFEYDGESLYTGVSAGDYFYLEEGRYDLIITDTNAVGVYVMLGDTDVRLLEIKDHHVGVHGLNVLSEHANKPLVLRYYASAATANTAGEYYIKRPYIFKSSDKGLLSNDFFIKTPAKLLESDLVKHQKGENLYTGGEIEFYYDGLQTYKGKNGFSFTLEEGDYTLTVLDSNAIYYIIYVGEASSTAERILRTDERPISYKFTVTSEHANQPLLFFISASLATTNEPGDYYARSIYIFKDDGVPFLPDYLVGNLGPKISGPAYKAQNGCLSVTSDTLTLNKMLSVESVCDVKKNKSLAFTAKFDAFSGLRMGHGKTSYGGSYIELYNKTVNVYQYTTEPIHTGQYTHELTISDFVTVIINVGVNKADITVFTSTGSFTVNNVEWSGCSGVIFAESISTTFTDCELKWTPSDIKERVWVFGDSYLGFNTGRWAGQMHNLGYGKWLASGFPGGKSSYELNSFKTLLTLGIPDIVVWCMGMNDGDNGAINSSWLSNVEEVMELCRYNNITLVLATIPTCPVVDNTFKNNWVRNSGYRYVDFDKAVGVNGTSWYEGMLAGDEIHPTELGARALASRVCIDVPEIMERDASLDIANIEESIKNIKTELFILNKTVESLSSSS